MAISYTEFKNLSRRPEGTTELILRYLIEGDSLTVASGRAGTSLAGGRKRMATLRKKYKAKNNLQLVVVMMDIGMIHPETYEILKDKK